MASKGGTLERFYRCTWSLHTVGPDEDILYLNRAGTWLRLGGHDKGPRRNARVAAGNPRHPLAQKALKDLK